MLQNKIDIWDKISITEANISDFVELLPLIKTINPTKQIADKDWKNIFLTPWSKSENYCGWKILYNNDIIGFMGIVFSERIINGGKIKFANRTSTIIKEEFRGLGLGKLLISKTELLVEEGYTVTTFSGIDSTINTLKKLDHVIYEDADVILFPFPQLLVTMKNYKLTTDIIKVKCSIRDNDLKIYNDHLGYACKILFIFNKFEYCMVVLTKTKKRGIIMGRIHYVSDWKLFNKISNWFTLQCLLKFGIIFVFFAKRPDIKYSLYKSYIYKLPTPRVYKSPQNLNRYDIDSLYSELILLNL